MNKPAQSATVQTSLDWFQNNWSHWKN